MTGQSIESLKRQISQEARQLLTIGGKGLYEVESEFLVYEDNPSVTQLQGEVTLCQRNPLQRLFRRGREIGSLTVLAREYSGLTREANRYDVSGEITYREDAPSMSIPEGEVSFYHDLPTDTTRIAVTGKAIDPSEDLFAYDQPVIAVLSQQADSYSPHITFGVEEQDVYRDAPLENLAYRASHLSQAREAAELVRRATRIRGLLRPANVPAKRARLYI